MVSQRGVKLNQLHKSCLVQHVNHCLAHHVISSNFSNNVQIASLVVNVAAQHFANGRELFSVMRDVQGHSDEIHAAELIYGPANRRVSARYE